MGVEDISHPSYYATGGDQNFLQLQPGLKDNHDGPFQPEALHRCRLCDICHLVGCLYGHRAVLCSVWWTSAHHTGVLVGRQEYALSSCFSVAHRLIPVGRGDNRRTSRDLHSRYSVLVHRLCLHSRPPHSSSCFHSSVVQIAALQRLPGLLNLLFSPQLYPNSKGIFEAGFSFTQFSCFVSQYLELRFSKAVRICGTLTFIFQTVCTTFCTLK